MAQRRALSRRLLPILAVLALLTAVLTAAAPAAAQTKPTAIVALGDSFISGEAAGLYESGTNGPNNWCHRSTRAEIQRTTIPGISRKINLACSGATTANVRIGGEVRYGEAPQAEQLRPVAAANDVKMIVLTIGANDVGFADIVVDCILDFALSFPECQRTWDPRITQRSAATIPKIERNIADIRTVMREAGYADNAYQLVVQGYASPVPRSARSLSWWDQIWAGCPVERDAMTWAHDNAVLKFSAMTRTAAANAGVRYLEMEGAFNGHEVCAAGATASTEWVRGTFIDPATLLTNLHQLEKSVQQSMHPHHAGHAQMGRCLTEFFALPGRTARCTIGTDGNLHAKAT
jgi:lysophospholipase L1-like esterase